MNNTSGLLEITVRISERRFACARQQPRIIKKTIERRSGSRAVCYTESSSKDAAVRSKNYYPSLAFPITCLSSVYSINIASWLCKHLGIETASSPMGVLDNFSSPEILIGLTISYSCSIFVSIIMPILDAILGRDTENPQQDIVNDARYRFLLYAFVPYNIILLACACNQANQLIDHPLYLFGLLSSLTWNGGLSFTIAHELMHKSNRFDKLCADILLCPMFYMHYTEAHMSHHENAGKPDDSQTARRNETVYHFFGRSFIGSIKNAMRREKRRLEMRKENFFSVHNKILIWVAAPTSMLFFCNWIFGWPGTVVFVVNIAGCAFVKDIVEYIQHYGLTRRKMENGQWEPISVRHTWNADYKFTNSAIFELQRHTHHHLNTKILYPGLHTIPEAPLLPASYPFMILAALFPPFFFDIMNPRIDAYLKEDQK